MATAEETMIQLRDIWGTWTLGRKAFVTGGSLGAIAIVLSLLFGGEPSNMVPLMTDMTMSDANDVTNMLDGMKVPYRLAKNGTAILVPADNVHKVRMSLAAEGLPKGGGVGFEIFDDPAFGMSRFTEKLNYKRGLEGELRRTIQSMAAVKDSRVHIVLPKRSLFKDRDEKATASITPKWNVDAHFRKTISWPLFTWSAPAWKGLIPTM
jgi:flagellar M-ring protein FliF